MRIAIDPVPLVLGIYAQVGALMNRAVERAEDDDPRELGRRFGGSRDESTDRDVKRLVKAVHTEVKTSDKLLKKTGDVWKISAETELVELVVHRRGEAEDPRSYVLLRPDDVREILKSIRASAEGAGGGAGPVPGGSRAPVPPDPSAGAGARAPATGPRPSGPHARAGGHGAGAGRGAALGPDAGPGRRGRRGGAPAGRC